MDSRIIDALKGPLRVLLMAGFILLAKMGVITYATPEQMHGHVNAILDFLVMAAPAAYALWVFVQGMRANDPVNIVAKAAALPQVGTILTTPDIAKAIHDPTVVSHLPPTRPVQ